MHARYNDSSLKIERLAYPLQPEVQMDLIQLLRTEWIRTDYHWLEAMNGDYSGDLAITSMLARYKGKAVATATVHFAQTLPEIAVVGNVLTHRDYRGKGLAARVIEATLDQAVTAGCSICLLGTSKKPENIYQRHGFVWQNGVIMRKCFGDENIETEYFAPGQSVITRPANWGDMPGLTQFIVQPLKTVCLDYPRGLLSGLYTPVERCVSNFPILWYDTVARDGILTVLVGQQNNRLFGFGSATPGAGAARRHTAIIDLTAHQNYESHLAALLDDLIEGCQKRGIQKSQAFVASGDGAKLDCLRSAGFIHIEKLPAGLRLSTETRDVIVLEKMFLL